MLLLFWRNAAPTFGTASIRASGQAVATASRGAGAAGVFSVSARTAVVGVRADSADTSSTLAMHGAVALATTGRHIGQAPVAIFTQALAQVTGQHDALASSLVQAQAALALNSFSGHLAEVAAFVMAMTPVIGVHRAFGAGALSAELDIALTTTSFHLPPGPFDPLEPVFLGAAYRGDTLLLPMWVARDQRGIVLDLTEADIWFTAKSSLEDTDAEVPTIQCTSDSGQIMVVDPPIMGMYQVTIQPSQTRALKDDTVFSFDVQVITTIPRTTTVRVGTMIIVRDVTRAGS